MSKFSMSRYVGLTKNSFVAARTHSKYAIKTVKTTDKKLMPNRAHLRKG